MFVRYLALHLSLQNAIPMFGKAYLRISLLVVCLLVATTPVRAAQTGAAAPVGVADSDTLTLPIPKKWVGDFDGMQKRRLVRVLVPYSRTFFFLDRGAELGLMHDMGAAFEDYLNRKYKSKSLRMRVAFIPTPRDKMLEALRDGTGDVLAGGMTVTPERQAQIDFTLPMATGVKEIVVLGKGATHLATLNDLSGREITVRRGTSYYDHLVALNGRFKAEGKAEMRLAAPDSDLDDEGILEMANAGLVSYTVVDRYMAEFWSHVFKDMTPRDDLIVSTGGDVALGVRKDSPLLLAELNGFIPTHKLGTSFFDTLVRKYLKNTQYVLNATATPEMAKFDAVVGIFKKYGRQYGFDYLMLLAQGYQESQLDQSVRSRSGAVGIMQLLPATAASPDIGITGIETDAEKNIHAGVRYLRYLTDRYLNEPGLDEKNKTLMAFAAYNAGPGNLERFRALAAKAGLDKNIWFNNVEIAAAKLTGRQTVDYVSNIYKYYVAYKLGEERERALKLNK